LSSVFTGAGRVFYSIAADFCYIVPQLPLKLHDLDIMPEHKGKEPPPQNRAEKRAAALRANLNRRKAQKQEQKKEQDKEQS